MMKKGNQRLCAYKVHYEYEYEVVVAILPALELVFTDSARFQHGMGSLLLGLDQ
jgi:hypothetical protein